MSCFKSRNTYIVFICLERKSFDLDRSNWVRVGEEKGKVERVIIGYKQGLGILWLEVICLLILEEQLFCF